ncbi:MAG: hypothetical protein NTX72_00280 [Candidatus Uhrbacteria bacterium]|nr:hypothetical protein [Candidatus Uhrbacteria bacterium]
MRLSRVVLTRGTQQAILQGMIHVGPQKLYDTVQKDMDQAAQSGYQVVFEGVRKSLPGKIVFSSNAKKIKLFLETLFKLYPVLASTFGVSTQKIKYPKRAINADTDLDDVVKRLDRNKFRCNFLLFIIQIFFKMESERTEEEKKKDAKDWKTEMNRSDKSLTSKFFAWLFFRKAMPIILDYRNEVAVRKMRSYDQFTKSTRNYFILYGDRHVKGLVRLLQKEGWVVAKTTYTDLAEFI